MNGSLGTDSSAKSSSQLFSLVSDDGY